MLKERKENGQTDKLFRNLDIDKTKSVLLMSGSVYEGGGMYGGHWESFTKWVAIACALI